MVFVRLYLWIAPHLLLALCLIGLLRNGRYKKFPIFFTYIVFEEVLFCGLLTIYLPALRPVASLEGYRWVLVIGTVVSAILQLATLYEIANVLILDRWYLARALRPLLRWTVALLILGTAAVSATLSQTGMQRVMNVFEVLNFSSSVINLGLLVALLLFTRALHVAWKSLPAGVVLGFGISSSVEMIASSLISLGKTSYINIDYMRMAAFHACVLVWLVYTFRQERSPQSIDSGIPKPDLEAWNQDLQRMIER
jgi:hypothetical protein